MNNNFTAEEYTFYRNLLEKFPGEKLIKSDTDTDVLCPVHGDRNPSLGIDLRRNGVGPKVVFTCRSQGCSFEEIREGADLKRNDYEFRSNGGGAKAHTEVGLPGCTLEEYAAYKNLPLEFLTSEEVGLEQRSYPKFPGDESTDEKVNAIYIPYPDEDGDVIYWRYRTGLKKSKNGPDNRLRGKKGKSPILYGLHGLEDAQRAGYTLLVEGESDCHTAWYHDRPAVGVPGVQSWKDGWAKHLDGIDLILVCVEPDSAGAELWNRISGCRALAGRIEKVVFE